MTVLCVVGTRPEAIKMAPVILQLRARGLPVRVLSTAQHRHMVDPLLDHFGIKADIDLDVMTPNQNLATLTSRALTGVYEVIERLKPALVLAQGDTTTVFATALACFYARIPLGHVEAGLRTHDLAQPFPEEFNRVVASLPATLNFAPTDSAVANLLREHIAPERIHKTGNTVIDALLWTADRASALPIEIAESSRLMLVTVHRRESFGEGVDAIFGAIADLVERNLDLEVIYPVHPNPNIRDVAKRAFEHMPRVHLCDPMHYPDLVAVMKRAYLVLTDSGGIQEEAPALGKPVFVVRETTERPEAVDQGVAELLGTDRTRIVTRVQALLDSEDEYRKMARGVSPYGDGKAAERIAELVEAFIARGH